MFRLLSWLFFLLALAALGGDLYLAAPTDGVIRIGALGDWWARIHRDSLLLLQPAIERHISPDLWDPGIQTLLEWPAAVEFAVLGAVFWLLRRRPRGRRLRDRMRFWR